MLNLTTPLNRKLLIAAAIALPLGIAACGKTQSDKKAVAALDEKLIGKASDPEMNVAVEDRILVDPELTQSANSNAAKAAPAPLNGAVPPDAGYDGSMASREQLRSTGGYSAPQPTAVADADCTNCGDQRGITLGALAEQQAGRGSGGCNADITYGAAWAERLPTTFAIFPRARLIEAGGLESARCNVRAASFSTTSPMKEVVDYYYSRAKSAGYSAEYEIRKGEHVLGGVRDKDQGAYVITFNRHPGGGTAVDIVANNGR
jgi:hypothetical protein